MFEDIVRFVVLPRVEAGEVAQVVRIERVRRVGAELLHKGCDAVLFFHRARMAAKLSCPTLMRDKQRLTPQQPDPGSPR
jgi:hypothetical protein